MTASSPDDIRAAGWSVAIHNDYRQDGEAKTFWLFTKGDRCVKGEASTDTGALNQVRSQLQLPLPAADAVPDHGTRPHERFVGSIPMRAPGCALEMWSGVIGINDKLALFDSDMPVCWPWEMEKRPRQALADYMIALWQQFAQADEGQDQ